jgi:hypothetical protein
MNWAIMRLIGIQLSSEIVSKVHANRYSPLAYEVALTIPVGDACCLSDALDAYFKQNVSSDSPLEKQINWFRSLPRFFFIFLDRFDTTMTPPGCYRPVQFPFRLDLKKYANCAGQRTTYQLGAIIARTNVPVEGHYLTFLCLNGQWVLSEQNHSSFVQDPDVILDRCSITDQIYQNAEVLVYCARPPVLRPSVDGPSFQSPDNPGSVDSSAIPDPEDASPGAPDTPQHPHIATGTLFRWLSADGRPEMSLQYLTDDPAGKYVMIDEDGQNIYHIDPDELTQSSRGPKSGDLH